MENERLIMFSKTGKMVIAVQEYKMFGETASSHPLSPSVC
jgi:hypothetical protein